MTNRRLSFIVAVLAILIAGYLLVSPHVRGRLSYYYLGGSIDRRAILITCAARDPAFRSMDASPTLPFESLEIYAACAARELLSDSIVNDVDDLFGQNLTMRELASYHTFCRNYSPAMADKCSVAYFHAIDWVLDHGADINAGPLDTVLNDAIVSFDYEMFDFLLSRGADPTLKFPGTFDSGCSPVQDALIDFCPHSAIELLELYISSSTRQDEFFLIWQRMLARAREVRDAA